MKGKTKRGEYRDRHGLFGESACICLYIKLINISTMYLYPTNSPTDRQTTQSN